MDINSIWLRPNSKFSSYVTKWAEQAGIPTTEFDVKSEDLPQGLLLINANQDLEKEISEIHALFDKKHIPSQRIDINGTLQVAVSNFEMWLAKNKCKEILILGAEELLENENLDRFFDRISK